LRTAAQRQQSRHIEAAIGAGEEASIQEVTLLESFTRFPATEAKTEPVEEPTAIALEVEAGGEEAEAAAETETEQPRNLKQRHQSMAQTLRQHPHHRSLEVVAFLVIA
jgi:hypothetical protein